METAVNPCSEKSSSAASRMRPRASYVLKAGARFIAGLSISEKSKVRFLQSVHEAAQENKHCLSFSLFFTHVGVALIAFHHFHPWLSEQPLQLDNLANVLGDVSQRDARTHARRSKCRGRRFGASSSSGARGQRLQWVAQPA